MKYNKNKIYIRNNIKTKKSFLQQYEMYTPSSIFDKYVFFEKLGDTIFVDEIGRNVWKDRFNKNLVYYRLDAAPSHVINALSSNQNKQLFEHVKM